MKDEEKVILNIGTWSSRCMACGQEAFPEQEIHRDRAGYDGLDGGGCQKKFTHVTTDYVGTLEERVKEMRPDLIWIRPQDAYEAVEK